MNPRTSKRQGSAVAEFATMGASAAVLIAVCLGIGYWIGSLTGADTVWVLVGLAVGVVAAATMMYSKIKKYL
jgi:steroid 5-alpha reductase family enzyme